MKPIAQTSTGPVEGREKEGVLLFASVPYAAPPVRGLRFRSVQPHAPWREVRPALKFGPAAPQLRGTGLTDNVEVSWDEDCLTLNVSTPALDGGGRPVLVWIHGGGYRTGQGAIPWYNGARFAKNGDIVVVSVNYRLGALGFTDLSRFGAEFAASGANGTLDQITALEWVRDNIAAFGGDPARVTIAGESAGGMSVATLLGSPRAQGLFRAVIAQSGAAHHTLPATAGQVVADRFLEKLGAESVTHLEAASVDAILEAQRETCMSLEPDEPGMINELGVPVPPFFPVVGNEVVAESPLATIRGGLGAGVPVLVGSNYDETTLWGYGDVDLARVVKVARGFGEAGLVDAYRGTRPDATPAELMIAMTTDHMFRVPAIRLAEARAALDESVWMYLFCWNSRAFGGRLKATHALEIPFAFDNLDRGGVDVFLGDGPIPQGVADVMHGAWAAFIRDGDPGWDRYDAGRRATMRFDEVSQVVDDPDGEERAAWEGLR